MSMEVELRWDDKPETGEGARPEGAYLVESYGEPEPCELCPLIHEVFQSAARDEEGYVIAGNIFEGSISSEVLRGRVEQAQERAQSRYGGTRGEQQAGAIAAFVDLHAKLEAEGQNPTIRVFK